MHRPPSLHPGLSLGGLEPGVQERELQKWGSGLRVLRRPRNGDGRGWGMFWAFQAPADRQRPGQRKDTGRSMPPARSSCCWRECPGGTAMINETWVWSRGGTDVRRREHLAPQLAWLLSCCGKLWPPPAHSVVPGPGLLQAGPHLLSPGDGAGREGARRAGGTSQHLHLNASLPKEAQGDTLSMCYPLLPRGGRGLSVPGPRAGGGAVSGDG